MPYSDADWAQEKPSTKFMSGHCFIFSGALVSWRSKQQSVVAHSSKEADFIALSVCVRGGLWFRRFAGFLKMVRPGEVVDKSFIILIGEDNMACLQDAYNLTISDL